MVRSQDEVRLEKNSANRRSSSVLFGAPLALATVTVIGLLAALLGGEPWYPLTWVTMVIPLLVIARFSLRRAAGRERTERSYEAKQ